MKLTAALQYEAMREDQNSWNKIYLNHDGQFFHAYNWSAWLVKTVVCTEEMQRARGDNKPLTTSRCPTKDSEYVITGFPVASIGKFIPEYKSMFPVPDGDGDVIIEVGLPSELSGLSFEQLKELYSKWVNGLPVKEKKQRKEQIVNGGGQSPQAREGLFCILSQVLSYPVERKSPVENAEFISDLKSKVAKLL